MATAIQLLRSKVAKLRPAPGTLSEGMPMVNIAADEPGLFFAATDGSLVKIGPAFVSSFPPNNAPAGFGGNTIGEIWVDTSNPEKTAMKVWSGSQWETITAGSSTGGQAPQNPDPGDLWYDTNNGTINLWNGTDWVSLNAGGNTTEVQYNKDGNFAGSSDFTFDDTTGTLTAANYGINTLPSLP